MSEGQPICLREIVGVVNQTTVATIPEEMVDAVEDAWVSTFPILGINGLRHALRCQVNGCQAGCLLDHYDDGSLRAHNTLWFGNVEAVPEEICSKFRPQS